MATSSAGEPAIELVHRRQIGENIRFRICFDEIVDDRGHRVENYLSVLPHVADAAGITGIAVLPVRGDRLGLMRMYRHPYDGSGWEIPMGFMDGGETPEDAARRELTEETGLVSDAVGLVDLGRLSPAPSLVRARIRLFAANVVGGNSGVRGDEVGHGRFEFLTGDEAIALADCGQIVEPCTLVSIYRYLRARPGDRR